MAANKKRFHANRGIKKISDEDFLAVWKYFEDWVDILLERQWIVGSWILALLGGTLVFSLSQIPIHYTSRALAGKLMPAFTLGIVGFLICAHGSAMILLYGTQI